MEGPSADSEEKREPASDIDTAVVDSLKVLDLNRPIREADMIRGQGDDFVTAAAKLFREFDPSKAS